ncbi:hypothetical protein I79_025668 [Cricetulus griseus]|uniref:Uncharacterized protein n=1 Tax=Cricetulus griseus TaxID=10029 RepID=G3INX2_CRIGR|nr:hypothetical protein I79_025668 [Cricetulus griseus]
MGWCAGLVKPNGGAEPTCEVYLLSIRSLDESVNLCAENREKLPGGKSKGKLPRYHLEDAYSIVPLATSRLAAAQRPSATHIIWGNFVSLSNSLSLLECTLHSRLHMSWSLDLKKYHLPMSWPSHKN